MTTLEFNQLTLLGEDAETFLQSQLTCDVTKVGLSYQPTAIANLKGRVQFGIWIKKQDEKQFDLVISADCLSDLQAHIKKFGAFSKFTLSEPSSIYPCVLGNDTDSEPTFSHREDNCDPQAWMTQSIAQGNYWITEATQGLFQPQELRLHQRGGVDYDKGCYLGQEVIARLYFKAAPKAFLHRVLGAGVVPTPGDNLGRVQVVNAVAHPTDTNSFEALVIARPEHLEASDLTVASLPDALQASVAREA